ncbi:hypothetical protein [Deinococcus sp. YIM 77859]|uniref:hypothetical protein n=1 Tax=Deinococcus sp. YIM 77859 TaxID=1540221 RepID=UPI0012E07E5B|nr:hypothetical protein [Deinococcus sp. YIM 77859]
MLIPQAEQGERIGKERHSEEEVLEILDRIENGETTLGGEPLEWHQSENHPGLEGDLRSPTQDRRAKRLKQLEEENVRLKKLVADLALDNVMLKDVVGKKWSRPCSALPPGPSRRQRTSSLPGPCLWSLISPLQGLQR